MIDTQHKQILAKFKHISAKIAERIDVTSEKLDNYQPTLNAVIEDMQLGFKEIEIPKTRKESLLKWEMYSNQQNKMLCFTTNDIFNLAFEYNVFNDTRYWDLVINENLITEQNIFVFVRMLHYYWTDLDQIETIIKNINLIIQEFASSKEIFKIWKEHPEKIFGTEEKSLNKYLFEVIKYDYKNISSIYTNKILNIKETDLLANLIQYENIEYLLKNYDSTNIDFGIIYKEFIHFFLYTIKPNFINIDKRKESQTLIYKRNQILGLCIEKIDNLKNINLKVEYKNKIIDFILSNVLYGDPRIKAWVHFENLKAQNIFISWLNEKDIRFFFECLTNEAEDIHFRKDFWIQYANMITESVFLIGSNIDINSRNKTEINKFKNMYKNKFYDIGTVNNTFDTNVFILRIKNFIFIEFSAYSNACYVYDYNTYCDSIRPNFNSSYNRRKLRKNILKNKDQCITSFRHTSNWQENIDNFIKENI